MLALIVWQSTTCLAIKYSISLVLTVLFVAYGLDSLIFSKSHEQEEGGGRWKMGAHSLDPRSLRSTWRSFSLSLSLSFARSLSLSFSLSLSLSLSFLLSISFAHALSLSFLQDLVHPFCILPGLRVRAPRRNAYGPMSHVEDSTPPARCVPLVAIDACWLVLLGVLQCWYLYRSTSLISLSPPSFIVGTLMSVQRSLIC